MAATRESKPWLFVAALVANFYLILTPLAGCRSWEKPRWDNPGPAELQRQTAEKYDPYPEPNVGQEIVGSRPPGYEKPLSEPERSRRKPWLPELW